MVAVETGVGEGDHLTGAVKGERGGVRRVLNSRNSVGQGVVDPKFVSGFCPLNPSVMGDVLDEDLSAFRVHRSGARPSIASSFGCPVTHQIRCKNAVAANRQIRCRQEMDGGRGGWIDDEGWSQSPTGLLRAEPANVFA